MKTIATPPLALLAPRGSAPARPSPGTPASGEPSEAPRRWGVGTWHFLESLGRARARRELREVAARHASTDPELARTLYEACRELGER